MVLDAQGRVSGTLNVRDVIAKSLGSSNAINVAHATIATPSEFGVKVTLGAMVAEPFAAVQAW